MTTLTPEVNEKMTTEITSVLKAIHTGDTPPVTSDLQKKVLEASLERLRSPPDTTTILGRVTEMTCRCGGKLQESRTVANIELPKPTHRKKRIRKKLLKKWEKESKKMRLMSSLVGLMRRPFFKCTSCDRQEGSTSAYGRNIFVVEKLEPSSQLIFDK